MNWIDRIDWNATWPSGFSWLSEFLSIQFISSKGATLTERDAQSSLPDPGQGTELGLPRRHRGFPGFGEIPSFQFIPSNGDAQGT